MDVDYLFQKTLIMTPKKRAVQPGDAIKGTTTKLGFENHQVVESQIFTSSRNRYHQWLPDIELIQIRAISTSYSWI
jgi:hypothetical protein